MPLFLLTQISCSYFSDINILQTSLPAPRAEPCQEGAEQLGAAAVDGWMSISGSSWAVLVTAAAAEERCSCKEYRAQVDSGGSGVWCSSSFFVTVDARTL